MNSTIEASLNALKLSYLRFVSDSAPGLILIAGLLVLQGNDWLPIAIPDDSGVRAFLAVVLILLATPLGLLINGAGHFCLGDIQEWVDRRCFEAKTWPIADTRATMLIDRWKPYFKMKNGDWPRVAHEVDDLLDTFVPHLAILLAHVRALKKFCRSIAFLAMVGLFVAARNYGVGAVATLLVGMLISLLVPRLKTTTRVLTGLFVVEAVGLLALGYWQHQKELTISLLLALLLIALCAIVLAGFVDFYQHSLTMLLVYQLLANDDDGFEISAANVRIRLSAFVQSRAAQKSAGQ